MDNYSGTHKYTQYERPLVTSDKEWYKLMARISYEEAEPSEYLLNMIERTNDTTGDSPIFDDAEEAIRWLNE